MAALAPFDPSPAVEKLTIESKDGALTVVPNDLSQITPYVLLEQEDWFEHELDFVRKLSAPNMRMLDIGANFGIYTLAAAKASGPSGKFWAVEPASTTADYLRQSVEANGFENISVHQLALSDSTGDGFLTISNSPELNALAEEASENTEKVALSTLDQLMSDAFPDEQIDFVKLDAEGAEESIIRGGKQFFAEHSPLVMFELKHGGEVNKSLIAAFEDIGYKAYVSIRGIQALRPFDLSEEIDGFQLNLFGCKPDRAEQLAKRGLLVETLSALPAQAPDWSLVIRQQPWATMIGGVWLKWGQQADDLGAGQYRDALSHWAAASLIGPQPTSDGTTPPDSEATALRLAHLQQAWQLMTTCPQYQQEDPSALISAARIARDLALRSAQLKIIGRAIDILGTGEASIQMPFLSPAPAYDALPLKGPINDWLVCTMLCTRLTDNAFSGFFMTSAQTLNSLQEIVKTQHMPIEVLRRAMLVIIRGNVSIDGDVPGFFNRLMTREPDHRNAELWSGGFGKRFRDITGSADPSVTVESRHPGRTVRVVHALARSGATIMSRCLAAMPQTCLFSEIHPLGPSMTAKLDAKSPERFNIAHQAREWFDITLPENQEALEAGDNDEALTIAVLDQVFDRERRPVVRDWAHLDFLGWQFTSNRSNRLVTTEMLAKHYQPTAITILRHPVTLLRSLAQGEGTREFLESARGCEDFLAGYVRFLEAAGDAPRFKYEDFVQQPDQVVKAMCDALGLAFSPNYAEKLQSEPVKITGDNDARAAKAIEPKAPIEVSAAQMALIEASPAYEALLAETGYEARDPSLFTVV
ncbi:MAG: FkbM family methyltransferase [Alphaproteobacteria bacterium]|nr:FkbM family methyltransferase [Alphaproteobacteria bacterium SS10]